MSEDERMEITGFYEAAACLLLAFAVGLMIGCGIGWSAMP